MAFKFQLINYNHKLGDTQIEIFKNLNFYGKNGKNLQSC